MSLILNIDCATDLASVCISKDATCIAFAENKTQKEHASFLHPAIQFLLKEQKLKLEDIDAFAITIGPGSYTGLRVAMATAKGLCLAAKKPLITINTLLVIAHAALQSLLKDGIETEDVFLCPMIDARRMEVFSMLVDHKLNEMVKPHAAIVDEDFINRKKISNRVVFCGNGSHKALSILHNNDAIDPAFHTARDLGVLSSTSFINNDFADLAYSQPLYLKEFYFIKSTPKG